METNAKDFQHVETNLFESLKFRFLPFWPLFAVLLFIGLLGAWGYLRYLAVPSYQVSASLLIKDEKKGINDARMMEDMDVFTSSKLVDNEIKVIQSRNLISQVVDSLGLYAPVFEDDKFKSISAYASTPIRIRVQHPDRIEETGGIYFTFDEEKGLVSFENKTYPLDKWVKTPYGILQFNRNELVAAKPAQPLYFCLTPPRRITEELMGSISIEPSNKNSTVVNLYLNDQVPQRGKDILNQLLLAYHQLGDTERKKLAARTLAFIEDRIVDLEKDLQIVEGQVEQYKSKEGGVNLDEQSKMYLQNVSDNDRKIAEINSQLAILDNVESYIISKNNTASLVPSTLGVSEPVLAQLLQKLYNSEIEYQKLKTTTAENNPLLSEIAGEIEKIRPSISENIRNQRINLKASKANLIKTNNLYANALKEIPQKERALLEINRQQASKTSAYSFLLQKREETALSYAPSPGTSQVVDLAEASADPVSPKNIQIYFIAIFLSLAFGVGLVSAKELMSSKVLFRTDIENHTAVPVAMELFEAKWDKKLPFQKPTEVFVIEQFRQLRASLGLVGRQFNKQKIMVTSSISGEGKSFVCANLAYSLAASGKKTILVDFDLRNPDSSKLFGFNRQDGLTEFLKENRKPEDLIKETDVENLSLLPAGTIIGDHTELLLNGKLEDLFDYLDEAYDFVILDTPPIELVSDGYLLAEYADTILYIMRHNYTPKAKVQRLNQNTRLRSNYKTSIVFTGLRPRGFIKTDASYGYGYGYGHGYGYGYGVNVRN